MNFVKFLRIPFLQDTSERLLLYFYVYENERVTNTINFDLGDVPYGLYGSSQFLSDHEVRVIAVGLDKNVHYEFLQSVASYRDVSNIFSVNSEQLEDISPYIYRDVCNSKFIKSESI